MTSESPPPPNQPSAPRHKVLHWRDATWPEIAAINRDRMVAILPVGAVEAHGPHLPLCTDPIIASAMAEHAAERLADHGLIGVVLPALEYTPAPFAKEFAGTLSVRASTQVALIEDIAANLASHEVRWLAIANSHLDPTHLAALYEATERIRARNEIQIVFPDICRKPWALRLGKEFRSGACHAGRYETSIVLAKRPDQVREAQRLALAANPSSLSEAIRARKSNFEQAGGPQAYFGDPAAATPQEGHQRVETLGRILEEAILEQFPRQPSEP